MTATATTGSSAATLPALPTTEREAWDLMVGDVSDLTAEQVRAAGLLIGGHRPGLPFPELYLSGDPDMRAAVVEVLSLPDPWNAQILVGMTRSDSVAPGLAEIRDRVLTDVFGEYAALADDLMVSLIDAVDAGGPGPRYDVPMVVASIDGAVVAGRFVGTVSTGSDTGERAEFTVEAVETDQGWVIDGGSWTSVAGSAR